jgi:hypothetical protein
LACHQTVDSCVPQEGGPGYWRCTNQVVLVIGVVPIRWSAFNLNIGVFVSITSKSGRSARHLCACQRGRALNISAVGTSLSRNAPRQLRRLLQKFLTKPHRWCSFSLSLSLCVCVACVMCAIEDSSTGRQTLIVEVRPRCSWRGHAAQCRLPIPQVARNTLMSASSPKPYPATTSE